MKIIFEQDLNAHLKTNKLMKIDKILDWGRIESILDDVHSHLGPTGYDVVKMFKCLLIQSWHNLSDPGLEESLRLRIDFLQFAGFNFGDSLPDHSTFSKFRSKLVEQGKLDVLFVEINSQLEARDLKLKVCEYKSKSVSLDSTVIEDDESITNSKDPDARWLKKGKSLNLVIGFIALLMMKGI